MHRDVTFEVERDRETTAACNHAASADLAQAQRAPPPSGDLWWELTSTTPALKLKGVGGVENTAGVLGS